jgi:hypothetical protein
MISYERQAGDPVVVLMIVFLGEEPRLDFEDTIEIKSVSPQHLAEVEATALRSVDGCIGIYLADTALDGG